jgi:hypothetical protein
LTSSVFFLLKRDTMLTAESTQEAHTNVPITFFNSYNLRFQFYIINSTKIITNWKNYCRLAF